LLINTIISLTQNGKSNVKIKQAVTRNTVFNGAAVTLELRNVQQLQ